MSRTQPSRSDVPSPKQLRLLRELALERGQSFSYPTTKAEASAEIRRLTGARRQPRVDREIERRDLERIEASPDASRVGEDEVTGYGSNARWAHKAEGRS